MNLNTMPVKTLASILGLIASIVVGWIFVDDRYVHAGELQSYKIQVNEQFVDMEIERATFSLNAMMLRERAGNQTSYDKNFQRLIEKKLERLYKQKVQLQNMQLKK